MWLSLYYSFNEKTGAKELGLGEYILDGLMKKHLSGEKSDEDQPKSGQTVP
jgi:hypothetical protein